MNYSPMCERGSEAASHLIEQDLSRPHVYATDVNSTRNQNRSNTMNTVISSTRRVPTARGEKVSTVVARLKPGTATRISYVSQSGVTA
jgi:hypothetical protein